MNLKDICKEIEKAPVEVGAFIKKESEVFDINRTESKGLNFY